jgi:hypothetical protein
MKLLDCQASIVLDWSRVLYLLTGYLLGSLTKQTLCLPGSFPIVCIQGCKYSRYLKQVWNDTGITFSFLNYEFSYLVPRARPTLM